MDPVNVNNKTKQLFTNEIVLDPVTGYLSQTFPPNETPVVEVSLSGQESASELSFHQAVMEIIPNQASASDTLKVPSAESLHDVGSAQYSQLSNVTISALDKSSERSHGLAEAETASNIKAALSSSLKSSWTVSSMIGEQDAGQLQLSQEQHNFSANEEEFRVQNAVPVVDLVTIPWKPATEESSINAEPSTTPHVINVGNISTSLVLQNAQEDFSVISEESTSMQEESLPIDAVIETIQGYVDHATTSDENEQSNRVQEKVQHTADWNFDMNMALDIHSKKHSENVMNEAGGSKPILISSVQSGKFTVTSRGLAPPVQPGVSLIRNATISTGIGQQNIQPIASAQPMDQPLHIQNEMYRLGLHVQIDKVPEHDNVTLANPEQSFVVPEENALTSTPTEVGNLMIQSSSKELFWKKLSTGKDQENTGLSTKTNITGSKTHEDSSMLNVDPKEYVQIDLEKPPSATSSNPNGPPQTAFIPSSLLALQSQESTLPLTIAEYNPEKTSSSNFQVRREIARIVILPTGTEPNDNTDDVMKELSKDKNTVTKKALLVPIKSVSRGTSKESTDPGKALTQSGGGDSLDPKGCSGEDKAGVDKNVSNDIIECEVNVLQRPKKITRYFKEKAKHQETKQDINSPAVNEDDVSVDASVEKNTKQEEIIDQSSPPAGSVQSSAVGQEMKGPKPFICDQCGRGFSHLGDYNSHVKTHKDGMPFRCTECGVGFRKSGHLINHKRVHTGEKPFVCKLCNSTFGQLGTLKRHMRIHTGEKPYECPTCKKNFSQLSYMKVHMRCHTGERPFKCIVCDHSFLQSGDLKKHMLRKHNTQKELSCPHCSKKFGDQIDMKRHVKTHEGKLECKTCDKKFDDVESAKVHKQMFHSKELPHHCETCDIGFKLKGDLKSHMRKCHPPDVKDKPKSKGKGKKRGRKKGKQTYDSDEDEDLEEYNEEERVNYVNVNKRVDDDFEESKAMTDDEKDERETVVRGTRKRKASKFKLRKLLPPENQDRTKRTRRSVV
ncbi:uncharacterized protein [Argopecten irradians]|uniref:uncharacterized protein n=1 Tax=Argopecten irradians TaxID=31199 RepID=UPI00371AB06A